MKSILTPEQDYLSWLETVKGQIRSSQLKARISVNSELILLYWELGRQIVEKQKAASWGSGFLDRLAADLSAEFPGISGLSKRNLELIRQWYLFYTVSGNAKQGVSQLSTIRDWIHFTERISLVPWGHHVKIIQKEKDVQRALFYLDRCIENNWSRAVLEYQMETNLFGRSGKAINNFSQTLPALQGDLAREILKDPYHFPFLNLPEKAMESDLERGLVEHISRFLLELGRGFAYMGRQFELRVGSKSYRLDLLFYHTKLNAFVNIELKVTEFIPEFIGKLNFYVSAIDEYVKGRGDNPTIGILLCRNKDDFQVEFALRDIRKPIGVSEFRYGELPVKLRHSLPSAEELQKELGRAEQKFR